MAMSVDHNKEWPRKVTVSEDGTWLAGPPHSGAEGCREYVRADIAQRIDDDDDYRRSRDLAIRAQTRAMLIRDLEQHMKTLERKSTPGPKALRGLIEVLRKPFL